MKGRKDYIISGIAADSYVQLVGRLFSFGAKIIVGLGL